MGLWSPADLCCLLAAPLPFHRQKEHVCEYKGFPRLSMLLPLYPLRVSTSTLPSCTCTRLSTCTIRDTMVSCFRIRPSVVIDSHPRPVSPVIVQTYTAPVPRRYSGLGQITVRSFRFRGRGRLRTRCIPALGRRASRGGGTRPFRAPLVAKFLQLRNIAAVPHRTRERTPVHCSAPPALASSALATQPSPLSLSQARANGG